MRKLKQRKHRKAQKRFAVEGLQLLNLALNSNHTPGDVFYCQSLFAGHTAPALLQQLADAGGKLTPVSANVMQSLSERDAPAGIVAVFPLFEATLDSLLESSASPGLLLVLDRLQDPGNLGTLIRTADAVAAVGVILIEPCVDPFDSKTVRGSMGSIFSLPLARMVEPETVFARLKEAGYKLVGADGYKGQVPWLEGNDSLRGPAALILGNEARGLNPDLRPHLTHWVRLPLLGNAESLNVGVAGGVLMYKWLELNGRC